MITNFEEITEQLSESEKHLLPCVEIVLKKFATKENSCKSFSLCEIINQLYIMENGFIGEFVPMNGVRLRKCVNHLRRNGILPVIATKDGYYVTNNQKELADQIKSLNERAAGIMAAANGLNKFVI